jgi:hypothetical protein
MYAQTKLNLVQHRTPIKVNLLENITVNLLENITVRMNLILHIFKILQKSQSETEDLKWV